MMLLYSKGLKYRGSGQMQTSLSLITMLFLLRWESRSEMVWHLERIKMKRFLLLLPLLLLVVACEEDEADPSEIMYGTWNVTNMGQYAEASCTGEVDYTAWAFAQAFGVTISFTFNDNGTMDMSSTIFGATETQTYDWNADTDEICIDGECVGYVLSNGDKTVTFTGTEDAYCEDVDGNEVAMTETECGTAGNDWYESACYEYTLVKE